jgi:hypothetical protein
MDARPLLAPAAVLALALALALAACSSPAGTQVADQVDEAAAKQLEVHASEVTTTCPDDAKAEEGARFDCDLQVDGQHLTATVEFSTAKKFTFAFNGQAFDKAELETSLKQQLQEQFLGAKVTTLDCEGGTSLVVIEQGKTVTCHGTDESGSKGTAVVGLDDKGNAVIQDVTN